MDPVTAINNGIAAFFTFMNSSAGQQIALALLKADQNFATKIGDLMNHIHDQISAAKTGVTT